MTATWGRVVWAITLFVGGAVWAEGMRSLIDRDLAYGTAERLGVIVGMIGVPYLATGLIANGVWLIWRRPNGAMWTWTVLFLAILLLMSVGGARMLAGID